MEETLINFNLINLSSSLFEHKPVEKNSQATPIIRLVDYDSDLSDESSEKSDTSSDFRYRFCKINA